MLHIEEELQGIDAQLEELLTRRKDLLAELDSRVAAQEAAWQMED